MKPTILIIFGATGDLSKRYLLPAIKYMEKSGALPPKFKLITTSRKEYDLLPELVRKAEEDLDEETLEIQGMQKLFHLAIPTRAYEETLKYISASGILDRDAKILLEKPFGFDLESAQRLVRDIATYFEEKDIYRVDHYLARRTAQDILKRRLADKPLQTRWNKDFIKKIEIVASEKIDIEGRVNFYEHTGALRDWVSSHLLELAALVLMQLPEGVDSYDVPSLRYQALKNINIVCDITKNECLKRGQYEGYKEEVNNPESTTETFVSLNLVSNDPLWQGVPITLTTGKALSEKYSKVFITFKNGENVIFNLAHDQGEQVNGYVEVYQAAFRDLHHLFTSKGEVVESWRILDAVQRSWEHAKGTDIIIYKKGASINSI